jgi:phytanoyl-CoA hydroxylase
MRTAEQRAQYARDGVIVLPGFKDAAQTAALRACAKAVVAAFDPNESRAIFMPH